MTEEELRSLISRSQKDGFRALFRQYQNYVYSIIWGRLRNIGTIEDTEECVSDVFADVFIHFSDIHTGSLQAYIGTAANRTAVDKYRQLRSRKEIASEDEALSSIPAEENIEDNIEILERNRIIYEKINSLGELDASLIIQRYYYDRKSKDIAKDVGLTPVAVRVRMSRALKRLKKILTDENISLK